MCYEERLFRSWFTKRAQRREREIAAPERSRPVESPAHSAPMTETVLPTEVQRKRERREPEEVV
jgi:hypothetical protein